MAIVKIDRIASSSKAADPPTRRIFLAAVFLADHARDSRRFEPLAACRDVARRLQLNKLARTFAGHALLDMRRASRCRATSKRSGKRCRSPAVRGYEVCRMHGAPAVVEACV